METLSRKGNVIEVKGDLIKIAKQGKVDIIVHGCNCFATMGAGIALHIANAFPKAKIADKSWGAAPKDRLGNFTYAKVKVADDKDLIIINAYTQYHPGPDFRQGALMDCLEKIKNEYGKPIDSTEKKLIAFPKIGCGIGGGNWESTKHIIELMLEENFIVMFVYFD